MAIIGRRNTPRSPCERAKVKSMEDNAPATQNTLKLLEAKNAAIIPDQTAVIIPWSGVAPLATAREMESGILIIATVSPAFQLDLRFDRI